MAKDEVYVPKTRSDLGLPEDVDDESIYAEVFGDTPIFTLLMLVRQQLLAFPAYLCASLICYWGRVVDTTSPSFQRLWPKTLPNGDESL